MVKEGDIIDIQLTANSNYRDFATRTEIGTYAVISLTDNYVRNFMFDDFRKSSRGKVFYCDVFWHRDWTYAIVQVVGTVPSKYRWKLKAQVEIIKLGGDHWKLTDEAKQMQRERQRGING